jgi:hypothetical protein
MNEVEAYIRQRAPLYGVSPDVAVQVALGEGGLRNPFRHGEGPAPRSQDPRLGALENSYGPFQLYISGTGAGLGDRAMRAGIDPRTNWKGGVDYALNEVSQKGWGQWYGAKAKGITGFEGVSRRPGEAPAPYGTGIGSVMDGMKGDEHIVPAGYSTRPQGPVEAAGGGYGSDPVNPAMQPPLASAGSGLPSVAPGQAGAFPEPPVAAPAQSKTKKFLDALSAGGMAAAKDMGAMQPPRHGPAVATPAARFDQGDTPTIDPQQAEAQRQMLAMAMQRLNSGRLF